MEGIQTDRQIEKAKEWESFSGFPRQLDESHQLAAESN